MSTLENETIIVGKVVGVYGVKGWIKIRSYTNKREDILNYKSLILNRRGQQQVITLRDGRQQGKAIVAHLSGIDDRDAAAEFINAELAIQRDQLPKLAADEYYWTDLIGLQVVTENGQHLGQVIDLMETGANDVVVVKGSEEHLIPFLQPDVIKVIDLEKQCMTIDWDPDF